MRHAIVILSIILATTSAGYARDDTSMKMTQYKLIDGRTLKDHITDGYELKSITQRKNSGDHDYFLQKGADLVMCSEMSSEIGGETVLRKLFCSELTQPIPYE